MIRVIGSDVTMWDKRWLECCGNYLYLLSSIEQCGRLLLNNFFNILQSITKVNKIESFVSGSGTWMY
jgi:hypothetical protein